MIYDKGYSKAKVKLKCEDCGEVREVQRNTAILEKTEHPCRICSNKRNGLAKKGRPSWNSGKQFSPKVFGTTYVNHHGYIEAWVGCAESEKYGRKDGYVLLHRKVVQDAIGRLLNNKELVHHIDGNKHNNDLSNLWLCESMSDHREIHNTLEQIAFELYKQGIIQFIDGNYRIAPSFSNE